MYKTIINVTFSQRRTMISLVPQCPAVQPKPDLEQEGEYPVWPLSTLGSSCKDRPEIKIINSEYITHFNTTTTNLNNNYYNTVIFAMKQSPDSNIFRD